MKKEIEIANPGPLGLLGFGMTTILLNLATVGLIYVSIAIIAMGIALGGLAQIVAGILEFKKGNLFGATAFTAYGFFWLSFVIIQIGIGATPMADLTTMGFYLLLWAIFTLFMTIATLSHNTITKLVFGNLTLLFLLLAFGDFFNSSFLTKTGGAIGIICELFAMYSALGTIVNNELGKNIFPL